MKTHQLAAIFAAVAITSTAVSAQDIVSFEAGSLIIPEDATFQTGCGAVSAYGLVYELLRQNSSWGAFGVNDPVTVYWVINPSKASPNRCVPTNKHTPPAAAGANALTAATAAAMWNDGCDLSIPNDPAVSSSVMPVVKVDFSAAIPATLLYNPNAAGSAITTLAAPDYSSVMTLNNSGVGAARFTKIRYKGGPFVIGANDAARVLAHLADTSNRANLFTTSCSCSTYSNATATACHRVTIHQSMVAFQAPVSKRINKVPPRIAVLQSGPGVKGDMLPKYLQAAALNFPGSSGCPPNSNSFRSCSAAPGDIYDTLDSPTDLMSQPGFPNGLINQIDPSTGKPYYKVLWMPHWDLNASAGSCATSDQCSDTAEKAKSACDSNKRGNVACGDNVCEDDDGPSDNAACTGFPGGACNVRKLVRDACQAGTAWTGVQSNGQTLAANILTLLSSSRSRCKSGSSPANALARIQAEYSTGASGGCASATVTNADRASALRNIKLFGDQQGNGIFAECAAIGTLEGDYESGTRKRYLYNDATSAQVNSLSPGAGPFANPQFMFTNQAQINGLSSSWSGQNCSDPDFVSGNCMVYPNAGSPFSQVADFNFVLDNGLVESFMPKSGTTTLSTMKGGVTRLAVSWTNFSKTVPAHISAPTAPASYTLSPSTRNWDVYSVMQKDNDPAKATIVYLGGHDYPNSVAGTRIALNTLLNLGAEPVLADRSITAPVAFDDTNGNLSAGTQALLLTSSFKAISGTQLPNTESFLATAGSRFQFPYVRGDLRAHPIVGTNALATGENALNDHMLWSADARLPAPGARNLFTYVGGKVTANPTLSGGGVAPHDVMQVGWSPLKIHADNIVAPTGGAKNGNCTDVLEYGEVVEDGSSHLGLKPKSSGDGVCDLQQLLAYSSLNPDSSWQLTAADRDELTQDVPVTKQLISMVRGYCYATAGKVDGVGTPNYAPALTDCNGATANNVAELGGLVNSTAAVVQPSEKIPGAAGHERPTVAYVGGYDGQLHAFYVSGGSGYTAPASTLHYPAADASSTFSTALNPLFSGAGSTPPPGTELWAFMPSTQFPFLKSNGARVDSSPVVQDVFVDLVGSGIREWHTIMVVSVGESSREVFAIDISDPLKPVLLWDLIGSTYQPSGYPEIASTTGFANDSTGSTNFSFRWNGTYDPSSSNNTSYLLPPATDLGRTPSGLYDYRELGSARSISIGQVRAGLAPLYGVFIASNSSGIAGTPSMGLQVFAIDIANGQKLWQWQREFLASETTRIHQNAVPRGVTLSYGDEGTRRLYVGDFDGRLWELDAVTGVNVNYQATGCSGNCNLAAFDTGGTLANPQPITSNISIAKVPPAATGDFANYAEENIVIFGTAGSSLVPPSVGGSIHALLSAQNRRKPVQADGVHLDGSPWSATAAMADAQVSGLLQAPANWPKNLTPPERVYGTISVAGKTVIVPAVAGSVNLGDVAHAAPAASLAGKTYTFNLGNITGTGAALASFDYANFGGVAIYHQALSSGSRDFVLTTEVNKIATYNVTNAGALGDISPDATLNPNANHGITYRLLNWFKRLLH